MPDFRPSLWTVCEWEVIYVNTLCEVLGRGLEDDLHERLCAYWVGSEAIQEGASEAERALAEGLAMWREDRPEDAEGPLQRATSSRVCGVAARAALACLYDRRGQTGAALGELRALGRLCPDDANLEYALGRCYEKLGHAVSAMVHYNRAVMLDPQASSARKRLAGTALSVGRVDEAIRQYESLCRIEPEGLALRSSLAHLYLQAGRHASAAEVYETAIAIEPEAWALEDAETRQLLSGGHVREAIERTQEQLEEQGPFADLHLRLANLYGMVGEDSEALRHYDEALDIQPGYLEATIKLATHHLLFGRWEMSGELFARAAELNERLLLNYLGMGVCRAAAGNTEAAAEAFGLAGSVEPNSTLLLAQAVRVHWKLARGNQFADQTDAGLAGQTVAAELLQDELQRHGQYVAGEGTEVAARYLYGVLLRSAGRMAEAAEQFLRAGKQQPTFMPVWAKAGVIMKEQARDEQAARCFHRMFALPGEQIETMYRLGLMYSDRAGLDDMVHQLALQQSCGGEDQARHEVLLDLVNLGLMDRGAYFWRQLTQTHRVGL